MRNDLKPNRSEHGSALVIVLVSCSLTLLILGAAMSWTSTSTTLSQRSNQYIRTLAAAEAATEKVLSHIAADYQEKGEAQVLGNLDSYRTMVPTMAESPAWADYALTDNIGTPNRTHVEHIPPGEFRVLASQYRGLRGYASSLRVISNAREINGPLNVKAAVQQDIEVATIPLFQFAVFYNTDLEIHPSPPMTLGGPVHCNANIYLQPQDTLTFRDDVTAAGQIIHNKKPGDPSVRVIGAIIYQAEHDSGVSKLNLPIGTNNSPRAVHDVVETPPVLELPKTPLGEQRYYNKADIVIQVLDTGMIGKSGLFNNFTTIIPLTELAQFVDTDKTFFNKRENKTIHVTEIDVAKLRQWNQNNIILRSLLSGGDVQTIYIADQRTYPPGSQSGVRLINGQTLPPKGLTVATPNPL